MLPDGLLLFVATDVADLLYKVGTNGAPHSSPRTWCSAHRGQGGVRRPA